MNCDSIASSYQFFEFAAFGKRLERHRLHFLPALNNPRHALVLGEGDGRFLAQLLLAFPALTADCVELSANMLALSRRRLERHAPQALARVRLILADATRSPFPAPYYDLIATHFFLDCFSAPQLQQLARKIARQTCPGGHWLVSEFNRPPTGWRARHADLWLAAMYRFFRLTTHLATRRLPPYREILCQTGFTLLGEHSTLGQLICSQLWQLQSPAHA